VLHIWLYDLISVKTRGILFALLFLAKFRLIGLRVF